jgi:hypothetical protein
MKKLLAVPIIFCLLGCKSSMEQQTLSKIRVSATLDAWHKAAA